MGWVTRGQRRYYYFSRKVGGRAVSIYAGTGPVAEAAAALDAQRRAEREARREAERQALEAEEARPAPAEAAQQELAVVSELWTRAALLAAGYRRHDGGEWRRKRVPKQQDLAG